MSTIVDSVIGLVLGAWLALSVANQFQRGRLISRVKRHDLLALIPTWTFFAPRPGTTDFHLMFRDCSVGGGFSRWRELPLQRGGRLRGVWNPSKRVAKGVTDLCNTLLRQSRSQLGRRLYLQIPYLTLLRHACSGPRTEASQLRQFAIVRTTGSTSPRDTVMLFVSGLHRLDPEDTTGSPTAGTRA